MDSKIKSSSAAASRPQARQVSSRNSDVTSQSADEEESAMKKLPPIKAPVGLAKSPDLKNCKSKVGSLHNIKHTPAGGTVTIQTQKLNWNAKSKVGSLDNKEHKPAGGQVKVETRKLEWKTQSKVQSLQNIKHKPGGGNVKIFNETYRDKSMKKPAGIETKESDSPAKGSTPQGNKSSSSSSNNNNSGNCSKAAQSLANDLEKINLKNK